MISNAGNTIDNVNREYEEYKSSVKTEVQKKLIQIWENSQSFTDASSVIDHQSDNNWIIKENAQNMNSMINNQNINEIGATLI